MHQHQFASNGDRVTGTTTTLGLVSLLGALGTSITSVALPTIAAAFDATFAEVQAVVVAYLAALTLSVLAAGWLGDRWGLKPMLLIGIGVILAGTLFSALSPTLPLLIAARAVQGVGGAFMIILAMALSRQGGNAPPWAGRWGF